MKNLILPLILLSAAPLAAQSPQIAPASSALFAATPVLEKVDTLTPRSDWKWLKGGAIGAGIGGVAGALATYLLVSDRSSCEDCSPAEMHRDRNYALGVGVGAVLGFMLGGNLVQR